MAKAATLQEVKGRSAVLSDGTEIPIPDGVTIADKSVSGEKKVWHLGGDSSLRVTLTVGDEDHNVRFRIRRVTPRS